MNAKEFASKLAGWSQRARREFAKDEAGRHYTAIHELEDEAVDLAHGMADMLAEVAPALARLAMLEPALERLAEMFGDGMTALNVGEHFRCSEADTIAEVLLAAGHKDAAVNWLNGHAVGDKASGHDAHYIGAPLKGKFNDDGTPIVPVDIETYVAAMAFHQTTTVAALAQEALTPEGSHYHSFGSAAERAAAAFPATIDRRVGRASAVPGVLVVPRTDRRGRSV